MRQVFQPPYQFNAIDEQSALKVDFWLLRDNVFEKHMFDRRVQVRIVDMPAWVATPEDLILHKLYWHGITPSDRQLGDAAGVFTVQGHALDREYLRQWARTLNVQAELEDLAAGRIRPKNT